MSGALVWGNTPVPWHATWSEEEQFEVRPCRWAQMRRAVWQPHKPGAGRPIFAKPHMVRQRMAVQKCLCSHCGLPTHDADRWWFGLGRFVDDAFLTTDSPMHEVCAELSTEFCPHLRNLNLKPLRWTLNAKIRAQVVGGEKVEEDFGLRLTADRPVIGHLHFAWPASYFRDAVPV